MKPATVPDPKGSGAGAPALSLSGLGKRFGGVQAVNDISLELHGTERIGVIGPNGAGKTTLFKMIAGKEQPDSGTVKIGKTVQMAFVDQHRDELPGCAACAFGLLQS